MESLIEKACSARLPADAFVPAGMPTASAVSWGSDWSVSGFGKETALEGRIGARARVIRGLAVIRFRTLCEPAASSGKPWIRPVSNRTKVVRRATRRSTG